MEKSELDRRNFIVSATALGALPLVATIAAQSLQAVQAQDTVLQPEDFQEKSIIGRYGPWLTKQNNDPASLSFRHKKFDDLDSWRNVAQSKTLELLSLPDAGAPVVAETIRRDNFDGLEIEELRWQLPYGRETQALLLKPERVDGPLPGILALHDHSGNKYFGNRKITRTSKPQHPMMVAHQRHGYEGLAWANEIAKRGYVVLVHDAFAFGSRRILLDDVSGISWGPCSTNGKSDENPELPENIETYNRWAGEHEGILSKSLFCAGTTWPGMCLAEDQQALNVLASREDVDPLRIGCGGLSGGGLRTVYLGGLDSRIRCAVCVGFMSTWNDFSLHKSYTHTWMTYAPLLSKYLDFPEILGLRVPLPTMVLNNNQDDLYTLPEMHRADQILREVFAKSGAPERYTAKFYEGEHKFDSAMQKDAFDWFDRWLKA